MSLLTRRDFNLPGITLAADARLSRTNYRDDHAWDLRLGQGEDPAITLETRAGGRLEMLRLHPVWTVDHREAILRESYHTPPRIVGFAPGMAVVEAEISATLRLELACWVMESQALGLQATLTNDSDAPVHLRADLSTRMQQRGQALKTAVATLEGGGVALSLGHTLGQMPALVPALLIDAPNGTVSARSGGRIGADLTLAPGESQTLRMAYAGRASLRDSVGLAGQWLAEDWTRHFKQIRLAAGALPIIETGDPAVDQLIALSVHRLVQGFLRPTARLPYSYLVTERGPAVGWSANGQGDDHPRSWSGALTHSAYLAALGMVSIDAEQAQGLLLNYLSIQNEDGSIDAQPGPAGQRAGFDAPPILARLALELFRYSGDQTFLRRVLPGLTHFYRFWFERDPDNLPQWDDERQMGYLYFPTFGAGSRWAQNAEVSYMESPDMAAMLLSDGLSLRAIARAVGADESASRYLEKARINLDDLWQGTDTDGFYLRRDRDTRRRTQAVTLLSEARADEEHFISAPLDRPARLILRVEGGTGRTPSFSVTVTGIDADGQPLSETAEPPAFAWYRGYGAYTTQAVFAQVDRVAAVGLSRLFTLSVHSMDTTRRDITGLLPLWSTGIRLERAQALRDHAENPQTFKRASGIPMVSADDPAYDPSNQYGGGGVYPFWLTLAAEGLWDYGFIAEATDALQRLLRTQAAAVTASGGHFFTFYHADEATGLGARDTLDGIAPLHLLNRVLGTRIVSNSRVWTGGSFAWGGPVTITQHGVTVTRSESDGTRVTFPSGHVVTLDPGADWQLVSDPEPATTMLLRPLAPPAPLGDEVPLDSRVLIAVEVDEGSTVDAAPEADPAAADDDAEGATKPLPDLNDDPAPKDEDDPMT